MFNPRSRKAFTVVELVIVIAVIAILAAVLIPTFSGIVKKAHVSNDIQTATNMTMQLRTQDHDIRTEVELKQAMDAAYGVDYFPALAPKSADQGYHFWFEIATQTVVLSKIDDLTPNNGATGAVYDLENVTMDETPGGGARVGSAVENFAPGAPRTNIVNGYYLMDRTGKGIVDAITKAETDAGGYDALIELLEDEKYQKYASIKTIRVIILTSGGSSGSESAAVVYISPFAGVIGGEGLVNFSGDSINVIPGIVIKENSLTGSSNITININATIVDGILPEVEPNFADSSATVTIQGEGNYYVDGNTLKDKETHEVVANLGYANPVTDFNITAVGVDVNPGNSAVFADSATNITGLYVSVTHTEGIQLTATPTNADASSDLFTWTVSDSGPFTIDANGILIRKNLSDIGDADTATVTATPRAGGDSKSFTVYLVKPTGATYTLDETAVGNNLTFALNYDGTETTQEYTGVISPIYNYNGTAKVEGVTITAALTKTTQKVEEDGEKVNKEVESIFSVSENGTITVKDANSGADKTCSMTIKVSCKLSGIELWSKDYTVNITDNSGAEFQKKYIVNKTEDAEGIQIGATYLFRVGNSNAFALKYLFENEKAPADIRIEIYDNSDDELIATSGDGLRADFATKNIKADGWGDQTIRFYGTGVAVIKIGRTSGEDSADFVGAPQSLIVEVVNGTNVTTYNDLTHSNCILLNDIAMSSGGSWYFTDATLYGNGFTFDVTDGAYQKTTNGYTTEMYVISLNNAAINNVKIVGKVYKEFNITGKNDYNRAIVLTSGNSGIYNSYISNGMSPVRILNGEMQIENTTLKGGVYANMDIRGGCVTLKNVTTINQVDANDKHADGTVVVGLGIVVWYDGTPAETKIILDGSSALTQYNYVSKAQADTYIKGDLSTRFVEEMFSNKYSAYQYNDGSTTWLNTGIVSTSDKVGKNNMTNVNDTADKPSGYSDSAVSIYIPELFKSVNGYLWTATSATVQNNYTNTPDGWTPFEQYPIAPAYNFDYNAEANYDEKTPADQNGGVEDNDYCYWSSGEKKILISMDQGDTKEWDPAILAVSKNGKDLPYTVSMNGTEYTDKKISFSAAGDYTVVYTYKDLSNFDVGGNAYAVSYTKKVNINVTVVKPDAKHATFDFGGHGFKEVQIGNDTYVMPNVTSTSSTVGTYSVNGTNIYVPIVSGFTSDGKTAYISGTRWYMCFPVFKNVVTITDYSDEGFGEAVTYGASTKTMPNNLIALNPSSYFAYATGKSAPTTTSVYDNTLCHTSPEMEGVAREAYSSIMATYKYTDNAGKTVYYCVRYSTPEIGLNNGDAASQCVSPDTLITLADGTQVRVDSLTGAEQLLVWNMETGMLDSAPIMFVDSDPESTFEVIKLYFSDGTEVKVIGEHGFWDYELNKYVYLNANADNYIGHWFAKQNGDALEKVQLVDVIIETEITEAWSPVTSGHLCYFVNGMLSMPGGVSGLFNIFDVDADTMTYDYEALARDIETYGLFTYEEMNAITPLSEDMFNMAGGAYLKISIGKGNMTMDDLVYMITRYSVYFD